MNTAAMEIRKQLMELADPAYKVFQSKLIPTMDPDDILGVRMPALRGLVREVKKDSALTEAYLTTQAQMQAPVVSSTGGEWMVLGLARNGKADA